MATTRSEPAGGLQTPPPDSREQSAAAFHPVCPDDKKLGGLQGAIEADDCPAGHEISFGPFHVLPRQRLLLEGDRPVRLGSRALDLLIALVERPGEPITKQELIAKIWPGVFVNEGNLKVHIALLRRALRDGQAGSRYISTVAARGYCFVAPVTRSAGKDSKVSRPVAPERLHNLPAALTPLFGRDETIGRVALQLSHQRLVTLVGTGGIGKTSLALAVARGLTAAFEHGVWFVDLTAIGDPRLVSAALASAIGLETSSDNPLPELLSLLSDKRMLFVIDNCEHVVEGAADLALEVVRAAPHIHILATSREPLGVEGERVHRLSALDCPPASPDLDAAEALGFPAVQLFVERAAGVLGEFALRDADVPLVIDICRKLDGIPLALEAAAADVDTFGIAGIASCLDDPLRLPITHRRLVAPRHRSLRAALDWSYRLLGESEQNLLCRLTVFTGIFSLETAATLAADDTKPEREIADLIAALVAKSLVAANRDGSEPRFRLPALTRAYALEKLAEREAGDAVAQRWAASLRALPQPTARQACPVLRHGGSVVHELRLRGGA